MKSRFVLSLLLLSSLLLIFSCRIDPCEDVVCDHGTCLTGECVCDDGFAGSECESTCPDFLPGTYAAVEQFEYGSEEFYTTDIIPHPSLPDHYYITPLLDYDTVVFSLDTCTVFPEVPTVSGLGLSGSGKMEGNRIYFFLTVIHNYSNFFTYEVWLTKQ